MRRRSTIGIALAVLGAMGLTAAGCAPRSEPTPPAASETNLEIRVVTASGAPVPGVRVVFVVRSKSVPPAGVDSVDALTTAAGVVSYHVSSVVSGWFELSVSVTPALDAGLRSTTVSDSIEWVPPPAPRRTIIVVLQPN